MEANFYLHSQVADDPATRAKNERWAMADDSRAYPSPKYETDEQFVFKLFLGGIFLWPLSFPPGLYLCHPSSPFRLTSVDLSLAKV